MKRKRECAILNTLKYEQQTESYEILRYYNVQKTILYIKENYVENFVTV